LGRLHRFRVSNQNDAPRRENQSEVAISGTRSSLRAVRILKNGAARLILAVLAIELLFITFIYISERVSLKTQEHRVDLLRSYGPAHTWWPYDHQGVEAPTVHSASAVITNDREEVLGVEVDGKARAYRLGAMRDITKHIVNDQINALPVSILYCDISDCSRVFAGRLGAGPLSIRQAGVMDGEMIVKIGGVHYRQSSGGPVAGPEEPLTDAARRLHFPYRSLPFSRTTWGDWKRRHPQTDIYTGESARN
jgi:hypothetical protein